MLKKLSPFFIVALLAATGCEQKLAYLTLNQDGSGTIRLSHSFDELAGNPDTLPEPSSPAELAEETREVVEAMAARMGELTFVSGKSITDKHGWPGYEGTYSFKDINKVKVTFREDSHTQRVSGLEVPLSPEYSFKYSPGGNLEITAETEEAKKPFDSAKIDDEKWAMLKKTCTGARETVLIKVGGPIRDSNADFIVGKNKDTVLLFDFEFDKLDDKSTLDKIEAMRRGKGPSVKLVQPGVKMQNTMEKVTVSFDAVAGDSGQATPNEEADEATLSAKNGASPSPTAPAVTETGNDDFSVVAYSGPEVDRSELIYRNRLWYSVAEDGTSNEPFSGTMTRHFEDGQLKEKAAYKDGYLHGPYEGYYPNGQLWRKTTYIGGNPHGPYEKYFEDGQLKEKASYKDGKENGPQEEYYEDGQIWIKTTYKDGKENGPWEEYYEDGQIWIKGTYKNGEIDGLYEEYYEDGHIDKKETYKDGEKDGPYELYYRNGQVEIKATSQDGPYESYYRGGQLEEKTTCKDGKKDGPYEQFYESGQLKSKGTYKGGNPHGPYEEYHNSGKLMAKGTYKDGRIDGPHEFYHERGFRIKGTYKNGKWNGPYESYNPNGKLAETGIFKDGEKISIEKQPK